MKKCALIILSVFILFLAACSNKDQAPAGTGNAGNAQSEKIAMLDEGKWPVNEYTEGLPTPSGTVLWATQDSEHQNCSINITGIGEKDYNNYLDSLKQEGFSVIEDKSEKIDGQEYVSVATIMSNGEKGLSISYIPDNLTVYISLEK